MPKIWKLFYNRKMVPDKIVSQGWNKLEQLLKKTASIKSNMIRKQSKIKKAQSKEIN